MKALVLGSSGFLGSYLGFRLPKLGFETHGVSRASAPWFRQNTRVDSGSEMVETIRGGKFDVVINAVALASHEACERDSALAFQVNQELPASWARECDKSGAQFVHISTDAVFSGDSEVAYVEDDVAEPSGVYGLSKLAGERAVLAANPDALVLRTNFFGWSAGGDIGILDFFASAFSDKKPITGFTDYVVSSVYVGHLVEAMAQAVDQGRSGTFHAVASDAMSKFDFGRAVALEFGLDAGVMAPGVLEDARHLSARGKNLALSTALIERAIGRPMPTCVEGLKAAHAERAEVMDYFGDGTTKGERNGD